MEFQTGLKNIWQRLFPTEIQRAERKKNEEIEHYKFALGLAVRGREFDREAQERYTHSVVATGAWAIGAPNFYKDIGSIAEKKEAIRIYSDALKNLGVTDAVILNIIANAEAEKHKNDPHPYDAM